MRTLTNSQLHKLNMNQVSQIVCVDVKDVYTDRNTLAYKLSVFVTYRIYGEVSPIIYVSEITKRSTKAGRRSKETQEILDDMLERMTDRNITVIHNFGFSYRDNADQLPK